MGIFTFKDFKVSGTQDTEVNIYISSTNIDIIKASQVGDSINYIDSVSILVKLRDCAIGEQISSTTCIICEPNTYTFEPSVNCHACPKGGNCTGGWKIYPLSGYWKPKIFMILSIVVRILRHAWVH